MLIPHHTAEPDDAKLITAYATHPEALENMCRVYGIRHPDLGNDSPTPEQAATRLVAAMRARKKTP